MIQQDQDYGFTVLVTLQKQCVCVPEACVTPSLQPGTKREAAALLFSAAAQQKKACEGSGYMAFLPGLLLVQIISITSG